MKEHLNILFQAIGHFEARLHIFRQRARSVQDLLGSTNDNLISQREISWMELWLAMSKQGVP